MRTAYKVLTADGLSPYRKFRFPLPKKDAPGEWVESHLGASVGYYGFHAFPTHDDVGYQIGKRVFEAEIDGRVHEHSKQIAASRMRLLREVDPPVPVGPVEDGLRPCRRCGKPHSLYRYGSTMQSWASLDDGHPYEGIAWEDYARQLLERIAELERL